MADSRPANSSYLDERTIRLYLRDSPDQNLLLGDFEFTPDEIDLAAVLAVDRWNDTPPPVGFYTVDTFPYRSILLDGVCMFLLRMAANRFRRNTLQVQIGGGAADDQDKEGPYMAAAQYHESRFMQAAQARKTQTNFDNGWGSV